MKTLLTAVLASLMGYPVGCFHMKHIQVANDPIMNQLSLLGTLVICGFAAALLAHCIEGLVNYWSWEAREDRRLHNEFARDTGYNSYAEYLNLAREVGDGDAGIDEKDGYGVWLHCRLHGQPEAEPEVVETPVAKTN